MTVANGQREPEPCPSKSSANSAETVSKPPSVVERADHHFCDREWYGKWQSEEKDSKIVLQCDYCRTEFKRYEASLGDDQTNYFCSYECRGNWHIANRPETECTHCGEEITRTQYDIESAERHFCSRECLREWQQETATYDWKSTPNYGPLWKERREQVLERENRTCQGCGRDEEELGYTPEFTISDEFRVIVQDWLPELLPELDGASIVREKCCPTGDSATPDALPILDAPPEGPEGLVVTTGFQKGGIMTSPCTGAAIRALITEESVPFPLDPFRLERFTDRSPDFELCNIYTAFRDQ